MINRKNIWIFFIFTLIFLLWWFWGLFTTSIDKYKSIRKIEITVPQLQQETKEKDSKYSPEISKSSDETENFFETALALHKLAIKGDVNSQFRLGDLLTICMTVAHKRENLLNNLNLLHAYPNLISADVLSTLEQAIFGCVDFYPENLNLFFPENEYHLSQFNSSATVPIKFYLDRYWLGLAALNGHEQAAIQMMGILPLPPMVNAVDQAEVRDILLKQLTAENPDLMFRLAFCSQKNYPEMIGVACDNSSNCNSLSFHTDFLLAKLDELNNGGADLNDSSRRDEVFEKNIRSMNIAAESEWNEINDTEYSVKKRNLRANLKSDLFRNELVENCAKLMRPDSN